MTHIQPVILSGGSGTRLWPLSRPDRPKQFLKLTGDRSMLQLTIERVRDPFRFLPPLIVANSRHAELLEGQLHEVGVAGAAILLEPVGRNTAPAIALAALACPTEALLLVMPSDHVIRDAEEFRAAVADALPFAERGYLLTFGVKPSSPETGYGYIKMGQALSPAVAAVDRFVEKPDRDTAAAYLAEGGYLWNAGIFLFRAGDYLAALEAHAPDVLAACRGAVERGSALVPEPSSFARSPSVSIDYAVMEKADRVAVAPVDIGWSDIGSWDALYDYLLASSADAPPADASLQIDSGRCLIRSDGPIVAAIGVEDLIIVATKEAVLVVRRGESQKVKQIAERLESGS